MPSDTERSGEALLGKLLHEVMASIDTADRVSDLVAGCQERRLDAALETASGLFDLGAADPVPASAAPPPTSHACSHMRPPGDALLRNRHSEHRYYFLDAPAPAPPAPAGGFDVEAARRDFPILHQEVHGKPLVWLDSAATSQKPEAVIEAVAAFYRRDNSNVHRAAHALAARATDAYEGARRKVRDLLGARSENEIVFVRGATEAVNLVAQSFGRQSVRAGDEILLTTMEHHANIVPWQLLVEQTGAVLRVAPIDDRGELLVREFGRLLGPRTRLVALAHVSNVLGTVNPVRELTAMAHRHGARVLVDGAQSVPHFGVDVQALGCDFYVFSGHKLFAPTGIGALYAREELLRAMPPWQGGGNMIESVTFERTTYHGPPHKFEAGTGHLAGAVGLGAAIDYLGRLDRAAAERHEHALLVRGTELLSAIPGVRILGTSPGKVSVLSFAVPGVRAEDLGTFLDREGIAVRAGHHCAQPCHARYGVPATVRASPAFYNTLGEMEVFAAAVQKGIRALS
jgi:SufS family cysteine desulfurase